MKPGIKTLTRLVLAVYLGWASASLIAFTLSESRQEEIEQVREIAVKWERKAVELMVLTIDVTHASSHRAIEQWYEHYDTLLLLLENYMRLSADHHQIKGVGYVLDALPALIDKISSPQLSTKIRDQYALNLQSKLQYLIMTSSVIAEHTIQHAQEVSKQIQLILYSMLTIFLLITLAMLILFRRWLIRPIYQLVEEINRLGKGDLQTPIGTVASEELQTLAVAAEQTRLSLTRLLVSRTDLEQEVGERTADLRHRTRELETANRDLEGFSYSVSHDLRAPLRAIDGFVTILEEDYAPKLDEEGLRLLRVVSDNARKMGELIDDILAFSRAGRLELQHERVDMNALVDEVWNALESDRKGRQYRFEHADLADVQGDVGALRQVWQNLLSNAIKFSRGRDPGVIEVTAETHDNSMRYSVHDNGVGFNPEFASKLFVLFQRLHGMDEFEGTGVGLAIVKRFIQKHGGDIEVDGELDRGATFSFTLPRSDANTRAKTEERQ